MADLLLFMWLVLCVIAPTLGSYCYDYSSSSWDPSFYCSSGCCGSYGYEYCCLASAALAGIVIASLFVAFVFVFIIVVCIRHHTRKAVIIRPSVVPAVAVVSNNTTSASMYPTPAVYPPQNYSTGAYPPQTYPPAVYPPQTYPPGAYPPQTYPPQVYPPPNYNNLAFPPPPTYSNTSEPPAAPANMATTQS